ncbi:uncharacterized protein TRAVEDRAFT_162430 [Trametes versicolor FP-101664 SS1]|uniref:uncharacterized protein n=1 Tax=Trametes versicolor (strain FP-101664) TaxID=717944 RepID=UPI0004624394|nr:uncharacterized protein TRAVEDRAFT_162430 [Trametes versicolor FP-101664 SS1]EIW61337.1 hypothetical protein TRAVEDRAFT_162430 [Trametes versicolor FP-101664 SS1]
MAAMPPPPFVVPPPLPPGWTEHTGPNGQPYYFNTHTQESTYVRPLPAFPIIPQAAAAPAASVPKKPKKEKPVVKTPIPGTEWLRVITNEGNTFYTHTARKQSVWTVPDEIKEAVEQLERDEALKKAKEAEETARKAEEKKAAREAERILVEAQGIAVKRKAAESVPMDEFVVSKKAKVSGEAEDEGMSDEEDDEDSDESEEEEWQKEAAAQLAKEAEEEKVRQEEERKREEEEARKLKEAEKQRGKAQLHMPERVDLSIEEAKALFKTLLREKNINPLHPWDTSLPLFVSDPRYVLLPSVSARRETFDEYCRERARELRESKVKVEKVTVDPRQEFERLLKDEVKSTRTSWTEWRRQWKKDRRFYGWGRDDREREKRFREYLKELGEQKRAAAQKAEKDFFALLKESGLAKPSTVWKDIKKHLVSDPRYDAVGSSSLREELFNTYLKAGVASDEPAETSTPKDGAEQQPAEDDHERDRRKKERKERAVLDRENKVRVERSKVNAEIDRSKLGLTREEGELGFRTMLTDAIRDPQVTWETVLPQLQTDPRFVNSPLPPNQQLHLFHAHVNALRAKHLETMQALFASHAPALNTPFTALPVATLLSSPPTLKLGFDVDQLEREFDKWQRERWTASRAAFDQMLGENTFVEFWGRLGKMGDKGVNFSITNEDLGDDDEEAQVDMKVLAKGVDLKEMIKVLKNDKRYLVFDHIPEQREQWLRDYLSQLSAPTLSVHVPEK